MPCRSDLDHHVKIRLQLDAPLSGSLPHTRMQRAVMPLHCSAKSWSQDGNGNTRQGACRKWMAGMCHKTSSRIVLCPCTDRIPSRRSSHTVTTPSTPPRVLLHSLLSTSQAYPAPFCPATAQQVCSLTSLLSPEVANVMLVKRPWRCSA